MVLFLAIFSYQQQQEMDDDQFYNPDNISIVSKVKQPTYLNSYQDSLSRIIREQAINYEEQNVGEDLKIKNNTISQKRVVKTQKKQKYNKNHYKNPQRVTYTTECYEQRQRKQQMNSKKRERQRKKQSGNDVSNARSMERRGNLLLFQQDPKEFRAGNLSKKQKRTEKITFQEQKTKKIEFQDIDRYNQQAKKEQLTKIRHQNYIESEDNLGIQSNQNSEHLMDSRDIGILSHRLMSNYGQIKLQLKEQIDMVKYLYLQAEKIDIRKMISKLQADIRRIKIGFRGLSESQGKSNNRLTSNIQEDSRLRRRGEVSSSKVQSKSKREKPVENYMKYAYDYGAQEQNINITDGNSNDRLVKLQESYRSELVKQNRFTSKLTQLQVKYHTLRANNLRKQESLIRRTEISKSGSIVKRSKILKEKIFFLKNEVKQTKAFYSNKIKRLRNQNTILKNQDTYIEKEIQQLRQQKKEAIKKNTTQVTNKHNLYLFDETELPQKKNHNISKVTSNKELISNIPSITDIKSLQSINSVKSINLFASKPSLGSINSYKSTKIESVQKRKSIELQNPIRNKLKINSPHHLSPPSLGELKQNSFLKRFKGENYEGRGVASVKKATSLDIAIKQLQNKYSKMMADNEDQYYR